MASLDPGGVNTFLYPSIISNSAAESKKAVDSLAILDNISTFPPFSPSPRDNATMDYDDSFSGLKTNNSSSFSHNSSENSTISTSRNPDDSSISKKLLKKRKKSKSLTNHDEKSDAAAVIPVKKSQGTSDILPNLSSSSLPLNNKYDKHCQGPFDVFIQPDSGGSSSIDPLFVGRLLSSTIRKDISEIKKVGYSKLLVQFNSREAANNLIHNPILKSKNLIAGRVPLAHGAIAPQPDSTRQIDTIPDSAPTR